MEQTFNYLLRERANQERALFSFAIGLFAETSVGIFSENIRVINMQFKNIIRPALVTLVILLLPLLAMRFSEEVVWDIVDFAIAGAILFGAGLMFEFVVSRGGSIGYRAAVGVAVGAALLLVWMNLAVGLIGNEDNLANLI